VHRGVTAAAAPGDRIRLLAGAGGVVARAAHRPARDRDPVLLGVRPLPERRPAQELALRWRWILPAGLPGALSIGVMWAGVFVRWRNLRAAAAHHCCWNVTIFAVGVPLSGGLEMQAKAPLQTVYPGSPLWTGGGFGPENSLINIAVSAAICLALWWLVRRRARTLPPDPATTIA
jgi:hypothetical protein